MIKKGFLVLIVLMLFSCAHKEKKLDVLWQKVIESKNAKEEEALENFWSDFPYERVGATIFYKNVHDDYQELEKLSEKDTVKFIKVEISFGNNDINIIKINRPKNAKNYFLLYRDQ